MNINGVNTFDPSRYIVKVSGRDYLEVKHRLVWLRTDYPDASIETEHIEITDKRAVFKASVTLPSGASATGYGSETPGDFGDYIEKAECLHVDAEILTRHGFVRHDAAQVGEDVLTYDPVTDACRWSPVREIKVYRNQPIVRMHSRDFDVLMTPDHKWATQATYTTRDGFIAAPKNLRRLRPAHQLRTSDRIILAAPTPGGDSPLTPDEAATIGWLVTDGTIWRHDEQLRATIYQSKTSHIERIRGLVGTVAREAVGHATTRTFPSGKTYACEPQHVFHIPAGDARALLAKAGLSCYEDLPALIPMLSVAARQAMREAMMQADGDTRGYFGKIAKPGVQEAWQILNTLDGIAVGQTRNADAFPVQRAKARSFASCSALTQAPAGVASVWCPTTDDGTWVTRLPTGQITITGNTKALGRALGALGFGTQFTYDFDEGAHPDGSANIVDSTAALPRPGRQPRHIHPETGSAPERQANGQQSATPESPSPAQVSYLDNLISRNNMDDNSFRDWIIQKFNIDKDKTELDRHEISKLIDALK